MDSLLKKDVADPESQNEELCPKLSYQQRFYGFLVCAVLGLILDVISIICLLGKLRRDRFPVFFTLGNIVGLLGTCFLVGPEDQFKKMKNKNRCITSFIFVLSMVMTLVSALVLKHFGLTIIFLVIQVFFRNIFLFKVLSYIWYTLSFIPFGQTMIKRCCKSISFD